METELNKEKYVEQFKIADDILKPDFFSNLLVKIHPDGRQEKAVIADWHNQIASITLHENVPSVIREQYDVAKNVLLYSWYSYRMRVVAWLYSYSVLENALRKKYENTSGSNPGLHRLLEKAVQDGLLNDSGFHMTKYKESVVSERAEGDTICRQIEYIEIPESERRESTRYVEGLCKSIPKLRNALAHGEHKILSEVLTVMFINAEIINMLFKEK